MKTNKTKNTGVGRAKVGYVYMSVCVVVNKCVCACALVRVHKSFNLRSSNLETNIQNYINYHCQNIDYCCGVT